MRLAREVLRGLPPAGTTPSALERMREMMNAPRESGFFPCIAADRFETDDDLVASSRAATTASSSAASPR